MGKLRNAYKVLVVKPGGKILLGRLRCRWESNILDLGEIGWGGVDWIHLAQDRGRRWAHVNMVMKFWVP
jgi:hypothetical protein